MDDEQTIAGDPVAHEGIEAVASLGEPTRRRVYEHVSREPQPVGKDDVASTLGLPRTTAGFHLDRLAEETGEAVLLSILDGESVLYLDRGQSTESFTMVANVGRRSPLHTNASGKVLLAHQDQQFVASVLGKPLHANTPSTVCNPRELEAQLLDARRDGYATCWQEQELGLCSIAVPIFDYTGKACAAMAIAGPAERVSKQSVTGLVQRLHEEAQQISARLGALVPELR